MSKTIPSSKSGGMPGGIPYIIGNEAAERFSFYGMKAILVVFMTQYLMGQQGEKAPMSDADAKYYYHLFVMSAYFFPIFGALLSDIVFGKYKTILSLSILYCAGHLALALDETRFGLSIGLTLIAMGSGGIKPCVSAHVGDQFGEKNKHLIERVFSIFYLSINVGALISQVLTPILLEKYGPSVAFGLPGLLMILATLVFWMGRHQFIAVPAVGWTQYKKDVLSKEGLSSIAKLSSLYIFISVFWSLFDQTGSSWILQAEDPCMNKTLPLLNITVLSSQVQAINPFLILIFVPLFQFAIYPALSSMIKLTPLRKVGIGLFITVLSFAMIALIQMWLDRTIEVNVAWQFIAFIILTAAEVMVSITMLEFSYTQAPHSMKSLIMGFYLLSVSLGNFIAAGVNKLTTHPALQGNLDGSKYFWFFTLLMLFTAILFIFAAVKYREKTYIQPDSN